MDRYGVSRNTVRLALGLLRSEGLVVTGQGRGSFVAELPVHEGHDGPPHARALVARQTGILSIEFAEPGDADDLELAVTIRPAPEHVGERLGLEPSDRVVERRRVLHRGDAPSHTADSYVPAGLAADSDMAGPAPLADGVAQVLARLGRPVARHVDEVTVRMPTPSEAQALQIATGVPVLSLLRTAFDAAEEPVCVTVALLPGDRHALRYDVTQADEDE